VVNARPSCFSGTSRQRCGNTLAAIMRSTAKLRRALPGMAVSIQIPVVAVVDEPLREMISRWLVSSLPAPVVAECASLFLCNSGARYGLKTFQSDIAARSYAGCVLVWRFLHCRRCLFARICSMRSFTGFSVSSRARLNVREGADCWVSAAHKSSVVR